MGNHVIRMYHWNIIRMHHWNIYNRSLTLFPPMYFDLIMAHRGGKITLPLLFSVRKLLLTWNLALNLNNFQKTFKKTKNILNSVWHLLLTLSYVSIFCSENFLLLFVGLHSLALFFLCFSAFCKLQCLCYKNTFVLTFIMRIFYFILAWRWKTVKLKKIHFFLTTSDKSTAKTWPTHTIRLNFSQNIAPRSKHKRKVWKFQTHWLSSFWLIKKTLTVP